MQNGHFDSIRFGSSKPLVHTRQVGLYYANNPIWLKEKTSFLSNGRVAKTVKPSFALLCDVTTSATSVVRSLVNP